MSGSGIILFNVVFRAAPYGNKASHRIDIAVFTSAVVRPKLGGLPPLSPYTVMNSCLDTGENSDRDH